MTRVRVLPGARQEIRAAAGWYESKRDGLGVEFLAIVDEALTAIGDAPLASPLWRADRDYRRKNLRRFPYSVFLRLIGDEVQVLAVSHQKRRPGYWEGRR